MSIPYWSRVGKKGDFMEPDLEVLADVEFWNKAWEKSRASSPFERRRRSEGEGIEFWNRMAPKYGRHDRGKRREDRLLKVIGILEEEGILTAESEILDVGCGPGTYALPFAPRCKSVTAMDGAREMCRLLEERVVADGLQNITVLQRMWEDVDLEAEGLAQRFDLVFASMTPAVCDCDTFIKLIKASKKHCCLISWAKGSQGNARRELWELIFNEKDEGFGKNIVFQVNLLFNMGYWPIIRYFDTKWAQEEPVDEAIENLCQTFGEYTEVTSNIKDIITGYIEERSENGVYRQETAALLSMMIWSVDDKDV